MEKRLVSVNIGLCQTHIIWENKILNMKKAEEFLERATRNSVELVLFPEMSFTGFSMNINVTKEDNYTLGYMCKLAKIYSVAIGFGWVKTNKEKAENHYTVLDKQGQILADYIKIHSFLYGGEGAQFVPGETIVSFQIKDIVFTPFICYDLRFPELFQIASEQTDAFIIPANWPKSRSHHWKTLLRARAIENQSYMLGINCVGDVGNLNYNGNSSIINPDGIIKNNISNEECIIYGTVDKQELSVRESFPISKDRREGLYQQLKKK